MIKNIGDQTLKLEVVDYPHNLCKIALRRKLLKPNQKTEFLVKLNRRTTLDKIEKSITLELNDKNHTRFTIPIKKQPSKPQKKPIPSKKG